MRLTTNQQALLGLNGLCIGLLVILHIPSWFTVSQSETLTMPQLKSSFASITNLTPNGNLFTKGRVLLTSSERAKLAELEQDQAETQDNEPQTAAVNSPLQFVSVAMKGLQSQALFMQNGEAKSVIVGDVDPDLGEIVNISSTQVITKAASGALTTWTLFPALPTELEESTIEESITP